MELRLITERLGKELTKTKTMIIKDQSFKFNVLDGMEMQSFVSEEHLLNELQTRIVQMRELIILASDLNVLV